MARSQRLMSTTGFRIDGHGRSGSRLLLYQITLNLKPRGMRSPQLTRSQNHMGHSPRTWPSELTILKGPQRCIASTRSVNKSVAPCMDPTTTARDRQAVWARCPFTRTSCRIQGSISSLGRWRAPGASPNSDRAKASTCLDDTAILDAMSYELPSCSLRLTTYP